MLKRTLLVAFLIQSCLLASAASAHYLWVVIDGKLDKQGTANIYFEGGAGPGDGKYLDPFVDRGQTWIRTLDSKKPQLLKTTVVKKPGQRWLQATLPGAAPRSIDSYGKWGVYRYGKTDVLLHYYSRNLDVATISDLNALGRAEQMSLDLIPHVADGKLQLTMLWQGRPVAGKNISIHGPKGLKEKATTNKQGVVSIDLGKPGRYIFSTSYEEKKEGTDDGKEYQLIRHNLRQIVHIAGS